MRLMRNAYAEKKRDKKARFQKKTGQVEPLRIQMGEMCPLLQANRKGR